MSRKTFSIFLILIVAIALALGWFFFFRAPSIGTGGNTDANGTNLFPFGGTASSGATGGNTRNGTSTENNAPITSSTAAKLRHISIVPTAGVTSFDMGSTTLIRYIERATGHIYETTSDSSEILKVSNTTLPKVYEALWSKDGNNLLIRYLKDDNETIRTFYGHISTSTGPDNALEGLFLDDNIRDISVFGNKIFYLTRNSLGQQGITANIDGSKKVAVFNSTFGGWSEVLSGAKFATLFPKPSANVSGSAYLLNTATGEYVKAIGDTPGIAALSNPDGTYMLASGSRGSGITTLALDVAKGTLSAVGISTLTDKCVWSLKDKTIVYCAVPKSVARGQYPDDWYKGVASFNDSFWKVNIADGTTEQIFDPILEGVADMDMMDLSLNDREDTLTFINKKDLTAWSYDLRP